MKYYVIFYSLVIVLIGSFLAYPSKVFAQSTEADFKVAFFGDQGISSESKAVLQLVKSEQADMLIHAGDFGYNNDPAGWEAQANTILGPDFPYFGAPTNTTAEPTTEPTNPPGEPTGGAATKTPEEKAAAKT